MFKPAVEAIGRNWRVVAGYVLFVAAVSLSVSTWNYLLLTNFFGEMPELQKRASDLFVKLLLAVCQAAANAVVFSWLGKDIDRPLWRIEGVWDALRRFFPLWLLIHLVILTFLQFLSALGFENPFAQSLFFVWSLLYILAIPAGACVMFIGRLHWPSVPASLYPLFSQLPRTLAIALLGFAQLTAIWAVQPYIFPTAEGGLDWLYMAPIADILVGLVDVLMFACAWVLLIIDREESSHDDFDF